MARMQHDMLEFDSLRYKGAPWSWQAHEILDLKKDGLGSAHDSKRFTFRPCPTHPKRPQGLPLFEQWVNQAILWRIKTHPVNTRSCYLCFWLTWANQPKD